MLKTLKELAANPLEKHFKTELVKELTEFEALLDSGEASESCGLESFVVEVLASGRKVYCPNRQNPARNRKHLVRSLLIR